jgi:hypothetical protein
VGKADREPLRASHPKSERNNRLSILLLRQNHPDLAEAAGAPKPKG